MFVRCLPCRVRDGKLSSLKLAWIFLVCDGVDTRRYPCVVC